MLLFFSVKPGVTVFPLLSVYVKLKLSLKLEFSGSKAPV